MSPPKKNTFWLKFSKKVYTEYASKKEDTFRPNVIFVQ